MGVGWFYVFYIFLLFILIVLRSLSKAKLCFKVRNIAGHSENTLWGDLGAWQASDTGRWDEPIDWGQRSVRKKHDMKYTFFLYAWKGWVDWIYDFPEQIWVTVVSKRNRHKICSFWFFDQSWDLFLPTTLLTSIPQRWNLRPVNGTCSHCINRKPRPKEDAVNKESHGIKKSSSIYYFPGE